MCTPDLSLVNGKKWREKKKVEVASAVLLEKGVREIQEVTAAGLAMKVTEQRLGRSAFNIFASPFPQRVPFPGAGGAAALTTQSFSLSAMNFKPLSTSALIS